MDIETMKKSWMVRLSGRSDTVRINLSVYTASTGKDAKLLDIVSIADLRTELDKREPMDLRAVDIPHRTIVLECDESQS